MWNKLFEEYGTDTPYMIQAIFSSIFVLQNRMQTAGEKIQTQMSMKQWLLIAMVECCPQPRNLTNLGELMGCSRQNVKKLAIALEKQGYVKLTNNNNNSVQIELTDKVNEYKKEISERHTYALQMLFKDFSKEEIEQLFYLYKKLYAGIERVEDYAKDIER